MKLKALRVFELAMCLLEEKGLEIKVSFMPHVNGIIVDAWKGFKWSDGCNEYEFTHTVYFDAENAREELDSIILKLQSL